MMWAAAAAATAAWLAVSPLDIPASTAIGAIVGPLTAIACALPFLWERTAVVSARHARARHDGRPEAAQPVRSDATKSRQVP
jgi:hypothetical protein